MQRLIVWNLFCPETHTLDSCVLITLCAQRHKAEECSGGTHRAGLPEDGDLVREDFQTVLDRIL